jgi:rhamnosyltransferase
MLISVCLPTWRAEKWLSILLPALKSQVFSGSVQVEWIAVDSGSQDGTVDALKQFGFDTEIIEQKDFDHGGTRTRMAQKARGEFIIFLTQDAVPAHTEALANLIQAFNDPQVAAVCGRQLPRLDGKPVGSHLRLFNYPDQSSIKSYADKEKFGIKTIFLSDSFAAYRRTHLESIGWFQDNLLFGEDSLACAKFILQGFKVAYCAEGKVYHSHDYNIIQEFRRYFDVGVFHTTQAWAFTPFAGAEGEGGKFIKSEFRFLLQKKCYWELFLFPMRNAAKLFGYKLGKSFAKIPAFLRPHLSMSPHWWRLNPNPETAKQ